MSSDNINKVFENLDTIRKHIFVNEAGAVSCYTIWSDEEACGTRAELLAESWKKAWENQKKDSGIYCIETDISEYAAEADPEVTNWRIWFDLVKRLSERIPVEELSGSNYKKNLIQSIYQYFTADMKPEDINEENCVKANLNLVRLFKCYTDLKLHIILLLRKFEHCLTVFPKEKDTGFFRTLFDLSPKGSANPLNLTILVCSKVSFADIAHHDDGISPAKSGYPDGIMSSGKLAKYDEEEFAEYLAEFK